MDPNHPHFTTLVSILTPIRIQGSELTDQRTIKDNHGVKGLEHMLDNVMDTSSHKNTAKWYRFKILLKIDDCDQEAVDWTESGYEKYKSYVDYIISPRTPKQSKEESISNHQRMHYSHIHHWLHDCYTIAPKSRYYWLWNHCNTIKSEGWDDVLYQYKGDVNIPISPTYPNRAGGALFPIIPRELVEFNITNGIETPVCGGGPFDLWWEQVAKNADGKKYGVNKCIDIEVNSGGEKL